MEDDVEKETIKLYNLKFEGKIQYFKEEKKEQELNDKIKDLRKIKCYKINDKKLQELEEAFKQIKTNIKLNSKFRLSPKKLPEILYNLKEEEKDNKSWIVYNEKYTKLIKIKTSDHIINVEKLENNDLVVLVFKETQRVPTLPGTIPLYDYKLLVYRLIPDLKKGKKRYVLNQIIKETFEGYKIKYKYKYNYNYFGNPYFKYEDEDEEKGEPIHYDLYYIKAISRNRFFCVSNYGFKIYALNKKNKYEIILLESYENIDFISEIDTYKFIFGIYLRTDEGHGFCANAFTYYYNLELNIIELKNIDKKDFLLKSNDCNKLKNNGKNSDNDNLDIAKIKDKLKFSFISQKMFLLNNSTPQVEDYTPAFFSDFTILKNKFFIIMIYNNILVFNIETGKKIKNFEIIFENTYRILDMDIKKWDCKENDEFILIVENNVILFKLIEENSSKINLNILNYSYFPELAVKTDEDKRKYITKGIKKINSKKNRFYRYNKNYNNILIYGK